MPLSYLHLRRHAVVLPTPTLQLLILPTLTLPTLTLPTPTLPTPTLRQVEWVLRYWFKLGKCLRRASAGNSFSAWRWLELLRTEKHHCFILLAVRSLGPKACLEIAGTLATQPTRDVRSLGPTFFSWNLWSLLPDSSG
jgi:hypothetical protein